MSCLEKALCLVRWVLLIISEDGKNIPNLKTDKAQTLFYKLNSFLCHEDDETSIEEEASESNGVIFIAGDSEELSEAECDELREILQEVCEDEGRSIETSCCQMMSAELLSVIEEIVQYISEIQNCKPAERLITCNRDQSLLTACECIEDTEVYNLWLDFKSLRIILQIQIADTLLSMLDFYVQTQADMSDSTIRGEIDEIKASLAFSIDAKLQTHLSELLPKLKETCQEIARRLAGDCDVSIELNSGTGHISANVVSIKLPLAIEELCQ